MCTYSAAKKKFYLHDFRIFLDYLHIYKSVIVKKIITSSFAWYHEYSENNLNFKKNLVTPRFVFSTQYHPISQTGWNIESLTQKLMIIWLSPLLGSQWLLNMKGWCDIRFVNCRFKWWIMMSHLIFWFNKKDKWNKI